MLSGLFERNVYKPGDYVCIQGKIINSKITDYGVGYYLHNGFYVTASEVNSEVSLGDTVMVKGKIKELKAPANDGQFNQKLYYQSIGIFYKVSANDISLVTSSGKYSRIVNYVNRRMKESFDSIAEDTDSGVLKAVVLGDKTDMDKDYYSLYQRNGIAHLLAISGVKTLKLDIPLVPETRINWAFVPLHIAIIYILKLCLDEEIIPRCRFPCLRGYLTKCINWQKKQ